MLKNSEFLSRISSWFNNQKTLNSDDFEWLMDLTAQGVAPHDGQENRLKAHPYFKVPIMTPPVTMVEANIAPSTDTAPVNQASAPPARLCWGKQALKDHGQAFIDGVLWIEDELRLGANALMPCMKFESGINPKARNPQSSASGLIQFMTSTALKLGTTIEAIREMDALHQLNYVYKYFRSFGTDLSSWTYADCYMAILWPAGVGKPMDYKLFVRGNQNFSVNSGLDGNKDGVVSKAECAARIEQLMIEGLKDENALIL